MPPQVRERTAFVHWQERLDRLPLGIREITTRHPRRGTPLAVVMTGGNRGRRHPATASAGCCAARPRPGRPRRRAVTLFADRGCDHDRSRKQVRARSIVPAITRRGIGHGSGLGAYRWVVERTLAWPHGFRRLRVRWEQGADIHEAFLRPGVARPARDLLG
ncbi:transposase [Streptomyces sp. NPDC052721]|uniref:transposase n=1 Tax=Streptomyces sp. NPDC052721 TaxID=3154955 RepID=UPI0034428856